MTLASVAVAQERVAVVIPTNASSRIEFGAQRVVEALNAIGKRAWLDRGLSAHSGTTVLVGHARDWAILELEKAGQLRLKDKQWAKEGFVITTGRLGGRVAVIGNDDSGALYGCLELAKRIRQRGDLPRDVEFSDRPVMTLRGTCVGLQKTTILPGRKVYEYPYTPELFPWFYDKTLWREYLDFLVAHRFNALFLWNGHPFGSLVRVPDYPDAVEVPPDVFEKNVEMFRWLATECDRRGIWLVQMFYNIFLPKPLAEKHGVPTQLAAPTPLASDYTRKAIAEFIKQYPNVGLMVCLGEALQGTENQINWATNTILPGVLDGMRAAGLTEQPPVVIRTHAMNPEAVMPECFKVYTNIFTETKYNGESLTTYEVRGRVQATHLAMAKLGPHIVNVHILSNLEPFRYGAQRFIKKCMQAARDRLGACGLHLYPLSYWNWPYSPDIADPPLKQWDRDWIWFEAWGRYAWNPDVPEAEDRAYWIGRLGDFYGCGTNDAVRILDAYNDAGEVAPMLIRRFGITEGNRQTLALGMTLDQLVNPHRYNAIRDLWESLAPPGERLDEFVRKEWNNEPHAGETPRTVIAECLARASNAVALADAVAARVTKRRDEFERFRNDLKCIQLLARYYAAKVHAAELVLLHGYSRSISHMEKAAEALRESVGWFSNLVELTARTYHFANSLQTGHRRIPFPGVVNGVVTNYHWSHVLPLYEKELTEFRTQLAALRKEKSAPGAAAARIMPWPSAKLALRSTNAETYEVRPGARPFADRQYTILKLAPELEGLTGIRFSHESAKTGRYVPVEFEVTEPVCVLIGLFNERREIWLQPPNPDEAADATERGWAEPIILNAAVVEGCPNVNLYAVRFGPGRHKLEVPGRGSFIVLGVVPQSAKLEKRDAGLK
ncbi:MAG: hypothetical protein NZ739_02295 [Verrucomicrobiae bacterium]|nr:hypothetical protein [Verrucomicrobiae bacterium]